MQQINLYLPEFRPNREPLRTHHMLWVLLGFFILLCCFSVLDIGRNSRMEAELQARQLEITQLEEQLNNFSRQMPPDQSEQLSARILFLQDELQRREDIARAINSEAPGQQGGFSAQLTSLARQSSDSLSLERFSLQNGGRFVELSGRVHSPDEVPAYLQRLLAEPSFQRTGFGVIQVENPDGPGPLVFDISKSPVTPGETARPTRREAR